MSNGRAAICMDLSSSICTRRMLLLCTYGRGFHGFARYQIGYVRHHESLDSKLERI